MTGPESTLGTIVELWRYPVKSFQGERMVSLELGERGVQGDREWALIERGTGRLMSAKRYRALFAAAAATIDGTVVVTLPDGSELAATDGDASDRLSRWLELDVELRHVDDHVQVGYEMTFDPPDDQAEMHVIPAPQGSFLDLAHLHLVSRATLAGVAAARTDLDWDVRRFRPNVVVELGPDAAPFTEDGWSGTTVAIGGAGVRVDQPTVRCAMPLRAQPGLDRQAELYQALEDLHANHLGVYCSVVAPGTVALEDGVAAP